VELQRASGLLPDKLSRMVVEVADPQWGVPSIYKTSPRKNLEPTIYTTLAAQASARALLHQQGTILAKNRLELAVLGHRP
jgi:hypothetical protein